MSTSATSANAPFALTYDTLISSVQDYAQRKDDTFTNYIPEFIHLAQKKIAADFKTFWEVRSVVTNLVANSPRLELPARWRKMASVSINRVALNERTYEYCQLMNVTLPASTPQYWGLWDYNNVVVAPTPDAAYEVNLVYFEEAQPLGPEVQENLITREAPQLMLAASLLQSGYFLKDAEKITYWQQLYQDAAQALKAEDTSRIVDRNTSPLSAGA